MSQVLNSTPRQDGFAMPAEWAPQQTVWMIWPYRPDNWRRHGRVGQLAYAKVAEAIAATTPVCMAVPAEEMDIAKDLMPPCVELVAIESDDAWCRDTGPTVVVNKAGEKRAIDWDFNAYGGDNGGLYESWDKDKQIASQIAERYGMDIYNAPLVLEGGSIHVDGEGTCLTSDECLLNPNRNPDLSRNQIEEYLKEYLNVEKVIWIKRGVYEDETSGHIDNMACFVAPGEVLLTWTDDKNDPQYERSREAYDYLVQQTDAKGRRLKVWKITQPGPLMSTDFEAAEVEDTGDAVERPSGHRLAGSYVNFLITNDRIVYPLLDPRTDAQAQRVFEEIFPDHKVIGVPGREILLGGGCIHCITQQIPA